MPVEKVEVDGLIGLVRQTLEISKMLRPEGFLWFRGLNQAHYGLVPKIMRSGKSIEEVLNREARLMTRFRQRSLAYWPDGYPQNNWEHLFAMQHFGLPTRLLDWSENLFVATYFASIEPKDVGPIFSGDCPVVWCFDPVACEVDPIGWTGIGVT